MSFCCARSDPAARLPASIAQLLSCHARCRSSCCAHRERSHPLTSRCTTRAEQSLTGRTIWSDRERRRAVGARIEDLKLEHLLSHAISSVRRALVDISALAFIYGRSHTSAGRCERTTIARDSERTIKINAHSHSCAYLHVQRADDRDRVPACVPRPVQC